jgi:hypothetical protein
MDMPASRGPTAIEQQAQQSSALAVDEVVVDQILGRMPAQLGKPVGLDGGSGHIEATLAANQGTTPAAHQYERVEFVDGSIYSGTLRNGQPDGLGTCTWADGNVYDGEWRGGLMHGFGTFKCVRKGEEAGVWVGAGFCCLPAAGMCA